MIKKIKLNNCTPYQQAEIADCKKINFFFGANGSGKSTIGSFLSGADVSRFEESSITWSDDVGHEKIEVYNRKFRQDNLQKEIQGIFTLGSNTIEAIHEIEKLKEELAQKSNKWKGHYDNYRQKVNEEDPALKEKIKEWAWEYILKRNDSDFLKAFEGFRGSKEKFLSELKRRIDGIPGHLGTICDRQDLLKRAQTLYASKPEKCNRFNFDIDKLINSVAEIRNDKIWNTVIIGNADVDIAALIKELGNSSWVSQGREYLSLGSKRCPFCQQETITEDFRKQLEDFFDNDYKRKVDYMNTLHGKYKDIAKQLISAIETVIEGKDSAIQIGKIDIEVYSAKKNLLKTEVEMNIRNIGEKITEPEKRIIITDIETIVKEIVSLITAANTLIDDHNTLVDQLDTEVINLTDDVWATCINNEEAQIKKYQKELIDLNKAIAGLKRRCDDEKTEIERLKALIEEKEKNITSVQPTIDEINRSLRSYGFTNFSIQPAAGHDNYYCIKRDDGTDATNTLSEGEETFLMFLYFMQRVKGSTEQNSVSVKKIIVLDDPVSSLDSTILYIVSAMVKDLAKAICSGEGNVTQLFVLTHNVYFHKEASYEICSKSNNNVNYWIVRKNNGIATIKSYGKENPISTTYELLWKELKEGPEASLVTIQNVMRRIIESYFSMLGKKRNDYLVNQFESTEDKIIAKSLLYWLNDGSHKVMDDFFIDPYTDARQKYMDVFRRIFEESGHLAHYNMMMGIQDE